jgi:hypothetical protein
MTIDERSVACAEELLLQIIRRGNVPFQIIIARHLRESVADRDALLKKCLGLYELGWLEAEGTRLCRFDEAENWKSEAVGIHAEIKALIGEQV